MEQHGGAISVAEGVGSEGHWSAEVAEKVVGGILRIGVDGVGKLKGAREIAAERWKHHQDVDKAVDRLIATHSRVVGATGSATGLGGLIVLPVTIPADVTVFYTYAGRCAAAFAHLRGYDLDSDEVRSVVLLSLLGSGGVALAAEAGAKLGQKAAFAALKKVPGKVLIDLNKKSVFAWSPRLARRGSST